MYKRHRYTGRRRNERKKSRIAVLLFLVFVLAVIFGSVQLGLYLKEKTERTLSTEVETAVPETVEEVTECGRVPVPSPEKLKAMNFSIDGLTAENYRDEIDAKVGDNSELSVVFRSLDGTLNYNSSAAAALTGIAETGLPTAAELVSAFKEKDCYVSAVLCASAVGKTVLSSIDETDTNADSTGAAESQATLEALEAYDTALVSELASSGTDEILLTGLDCSEKYVESIVAFAKKIREKMPENVPLGLVISYGTLTSDGAAELCRRYSACFDFLAVDYTDFDYGEENDIGVTLKARIDTMQLYFSKYNMRVVFDFDRLGKQISAVETLLDAQSLFNSQYISLSDLTGKTDESDDVDATD